MEEDSGIGCGEETRGGTGAGLASRGSVLLYMRDISGLSDETANHHARCWLVCGHREGAMWEGKLEADWEGPEA